MSREKELCRHAFEEWKSVKELVVVGPDQSVSRLPIFSFLVRHRDSGLFLHHNFVCVLLNDLFGIQARGGCACAGPYGQVTVISKQLHGLHYIQWSPSDPNVDTHVLCMDTLECPKVYTLLYSPEMRTSR